MEKDIYNVSVSLIDTMEYGSLEAFIIGIFKQIGEHDKNTQQYSLSTDELLKWFGSVDNPSVFSALKTLSEKGVIYIECDGSLVMGM